MRTITTTQVRTTARLTVAAAIALSLGACGTIDDLTGTEPGTVTPQSGGAPQSSDAPQSTEVTGTTAGQSHQTSATAQPSTTVAAEDNANTETDAPAGNAQSPTADQPLNDEAVSAEASEAGRIETLDADGGIIVDGTRVTFVYVNGTQYTADIGTPVGEPPFDYTNGRTTLALEEDGTGMLIDGAAITSINPDGSGAIAEGNGILAIEADGSTSCVTGDSYSWANADGSGGAGNADGLLVIDGSGTLTLGTAPSPTDAVGRYTACNVAGTARVDLSADVLFEFGSAELSDEGRAVITEVAETMATQSVASATVTGHTDWVGSTAFNQDLGQQRADAVAGLLAQVVPDLNLDTDSAGESLPVAPNANPDGTDNPAGRTLNRRVEIVFATQ